VRGCSVAASRHGATGMPGREPAKHPTDRPRRLSSRRERLRGAAHCAHQRTAAVGRVASRRERAWHDSCRHVR
jgi:hypothetical protein